MKWLIITSVQLRITKLLIDQILTNKHYRTLGRSNNRRVRSDWTSSFYGEQSTVKIGEKEKIFTEVRKLKSKQ